MAPGGMEVIPLPPKRPHPGSVEEREVGGRFRPESGRLRLAVHRFSRPALALRHEVHHPHPGRESKRDEARPIPPRQASSAI